MIPDLKLVKPEPNISSNKSAFLGPKIWKKPLHFRNGATGGNNGAGMEGTGTEFSVMNIDDFSRNVPEDDRDQGMAMPPNGGNSYRNPNSVSSEDGMMETEQPISPPVQVVMPQSPSRNDFCLKRRADFESNQSQLTNISQWNKSKNDGPKGKNDFLYVESKRARLEREKEERGRREEVRVE